jgi:hypothetical protein
MENFMLSMKINYLSSFKHKHKYQTVVMKINYLTSLSRIEVMKFSMNISYLASLLGSSCFLLDIRHVTHGQASDEYAYA